MSQPGQAFLVPLADRGFVSVDPETNPVRWYYETPEGKLSVYGYMSASDARQAARDEGYWIEEP